MTRSVKLIGSALAAGLMLAGAGSEVRADGYRAPAVAYEAPVSWSGFYAGANVGGSWSSLQDEWPITDHFFVRGTSFDLSSGSVTAGVHGGLQHQWSSLVVGVELSANTYHRMDDRVLSLTSPPCTFNVIGNGTPCGVANTVNWSAQAVGRLGIAIGAFLPYAKGGIAVIDITEREVNCCIPLGVVSGAFVSPGQMSRDEKEQAGWVVGGGLEWRVNKDLVLGVDYQHIFINDGTHSAACVGGGTTVCSAPVPFGNVRINGDIDTVTARLSFLFGREPAAAAPMK